MRAKLNRCGLIATLSAALISVNVVPVMPVAAQVQPAVARNWADGTASQIKGKTYVERALGKCVVSIAGGAILGALIGAAAGSAKNGALIGGGVGVGLCAVLLKIGSDKDKQVLRQAQINAANLGQQQYTSWRSSEGNYAEVRVTPSGTVPLVVSEKGSIKCRSDNQCLVNDSWVPYESLMAPPTSGLQKVSSQVQVYKCRRLQTDVSVDGRISNSGSDAVCLVGDSWITGDQLKKMRIRDDDIVTS